jgi:hypothetical protein
VIVKPKPGGGSFEKWLDANIAITVLAVRSAPEGSKLLLWSDAQETAALFPASDFDIVDFTIPSVWVANIDLNGYVELSPHEW